MALYSDYTSCNQIEGIDVKITPERLLAALDILFPEEKVKEKDEDIWQVLSPHWKISDYVKHELVYGRTVVADRLVITLDGTDGSGARFSLEYLDREDRQLLKLVGLPRIAVGNTLTIMPLSEALTIKVS